MEYQLHRLEWDSNFFGFSVANFEGVINNKTLEKIYLENIDLVYYSSQSLLNDKFKENIFYNIQLVDSKVALKRILSDDKEMHPNVSLYDGLEANDQLIYLAQHAGGHTRFNKDPNISDKKYKELFTIWIERSVKREIADYILVYKDNGQIVGFAVIDLRLSGPYVSLLAVDFKYEGKGVAFALMRSIEKILSDKGFTEVHGATQLDNRKALIVYERYGLVRQPVNYVYHFWRK